MVSLSLRVDGVLERIQLQRDGVPVELGSGVAGKAGELDHLVARAHWRAVGKRPYAIFIPVLEYFYGALLRGTLLGQRHIARRYSPIGQLSARCGQQQQAQEKSQQNFHAIRTLANHAANCTPAAGAQYPIPAPKKVRNVHYVAPDGADTAPPELRDPAPPARATT